MRKSITDRGIPAVFHCQVVELVSDCGVSLIFRLVINWVTYLISLGPQPHLINWSFIVCSPTFSNAFSKSRDIIKRALLIRKSTCSRQSVTDFPFLNPT